MQKLTERVDELLGMLTIKADDIKEKVLSIVKDAIPGAVNMEFRGIFHDDHPSLSMANDLRARCKVVFMFLGKPFTIAFVGWSEPRICMCDSSASGIAATCKVSRMEDLPTIIACRLLHLDDKATENLDGRFMSDECEFGIGENGNGMLIMHGTYNSKEGNPMATLEFRVHGDDTEHADVRVYDGDTLIAEFNGIGVFHDHYDKDIDEAIEDYLKQGKEEPAETEPDTPPVECKTWNEFWDYVYDENSEPHVILRNFANLISEYTDGEACDDQMNRKVYFKYKGIEFAAHFESDDSFNIWYFQIEATDGVLDAGFHHFNRDDDFVKFMKNIVETRYHEPVKEPEEDICKGIFDSIESLDKSSDLMCSEAGCETRSLIDKFFENTHGLIDKFFKTYLPTATVKSLSLETDCFCKPGNHTKWIAVNFDCASALNLNLIFGVSGYGERDMTLWAKGSEGIIEREIFKEPAKIGDALKNIETRVNGAPKKEPLTDHERIERLERIVDAIQDEITKLKNR